MPKKKQANWMKSGTLSKGELITKETSGNEGDNVTYGRVTKMLGGFNVTVYCSSTNREHLCIIRGNMRNKHRMMIYIDDIVLVALREFDNKSKGDILTRYTQEETQSLKHIAKEVVSLTSIGKTKNDINEVQFEDEVVFESI